MKKGWKHPLIATGLTVALLSALPAIGMADTRDLTNQACSMTISAGEFEDLKDANVVLDVYKVADAVPVEGYDTYAFDLKDTYTIEALKVLEEAPESIEREDWAGLADAAARQTLLSGNTIAPVASDVEAGTKIDVDSGLYLVIARSAGLENYYTTVEDEDGNEKVVTIAQTDDYEYTYAPELVALPTKEGLSTAQDAGEWIFDLTGAAMKPAQADRYGNLIITKTLQNYITTGSGSQQTFVFNVKAVRRGEVVFDEDFGFYFSAAGTKSCEIMGKIPVGAEVTVTEEYSGSSYSCLSDKTQTVEILAPKDEQGNEQAVEAAFVNGTGDKPSVIQGGGVINKFDYGEDANGNPALNFAGNDTDNSVSSK